MFKRTTIGFAAIFALIAVACNGSSKGPTGVVSAHLVTGGMDGDIASVLVEVSRAGQSVTSRTLALRPDQPSGGGAVTGGDALFVLPADTYQVSAVALGADGRPAPRCARSSTNAEVHALRTTEIALAILCDGKDSGGLDVVVTVQDAPMITKLTLDPGKFVTTCTTVGMDTTAVVNPPGPLTYAWIVSAAPPGATPVLTVSGNHATFVTTTPGEYEISVTVTAASGQDTSLSFPLHVSGPAVALCGPTDCAPKESCFNGKDDDCDGLTDCADPDCNAGALCVAAPAETGFAVGVTVGAGDACPSGYAAASLINAGLSAPASCGGCACGGGATTCRLARIDYAGPNQEANCDADNGVDVGGPTFGALTIASGMSQGGCQPAGGGLHGGLGTSTRFDDAFTVSMTCGSPSGAPVLPAPSWATSRTFCQPLAVGTGCDASSVCVPRPPSRDVPTCVVADGAAACPSGYTDQGPFYTGFADARSCGACGCGSPAGGSCAGVRLQQSMGCSPTDPSLRDEPLGFGDCGYEFSYRLSGTATPPVCAATSPVSGTLTPTGRHTLCCS